MVRLLFFLLVVFVLGLGFAWLADRPGDLVVTFGGWRYQTTLMVAGVAVVALVAAAMIVWWCLKAVWMSPFTLSRYFRVRRRDRGYQALSTGMIAAGAGDVGTARRKMTEAGKLISADQEPLIHLLEAQTALLEGDRQAARQKFEAMLDDPELRLLGLRGLYLEAERLGEKAAARHYSGRAAALAPQLGWAAEATLAERIETGDWDSALALCDARKPAGAAEKKAAARRRAVLLTAKAEALADSDPTVARAAALEANRLEPLFAPAAVAAAKALYRSGDLRRGTKILEAAWKAEPLPEIAAAYVHARPGDAAGDRLARARKLAALRTNNPESSLAVARAALEAGDFALARAETEAAIRMAPREGAYLLLADIEEAETGDQGKVRALLGRALRAPGDPAWVADGVVSEKWAPISPVTGRLDAFEWRAPVERLGAVIEPEADIAPPPRIEARPETPPAPPPSAEPLHEAEITDLPARMAEAEAAPAATEGAVPDRAPDDPGVEEEPETQDRDASRFRLF